MTPIPRLFATVCLLPLAALAQQAYVSNQNGGLSVIDLPAQAISATLDSHGREPRGIGVTADGHWLVVAHRADGAVTILERRTGTLVRKVRVGPNPEFVRVRGRLAFVSYEPSSTGKPPGQAPRHEDDDAAAEPARIAIIDLDQGRVLRSVQGGPETEGIEFAADGNHILVTNEADDTVTVHEIATGRLVQTVDLKPYGHRPRGIKRAPGGQAYVVTLELANAFVVLGPDYRVLRQVETGESPYGVSFDRAGQRLFVAAGRSQRLQVFDATSWQKVKDVPTGKRCWHFTFTPDDRQLLVACGRSDEVLVIDAVALEPVTRITGLQLPWGVVTYPKAMGSLDEPE